MAEGGGLLNRYTLQRRIEGSNPSGSASFKSAKCPELVFGGCLKIKPSTAHVKDCGADGAPKAAVSMHQKEEILPNYRRLVVIATAAISY